MKSEISKFINKAVRSVLWRTGLGRKAGETFWHVRREGPGYQTLRFREKRVFDEVPTDFDNAEFSAYMKSENAKHTQQSEYVLTIEDVLLEPERLLGIRAGRELVGQTVVYTVDHQYPYILPFLLGQHQRKPLAEAILYDGSATRNYYHHFVDALSQLVFLPASGVPLHLPLLVSRAMYEKDFFQYLYKRSAYFRNFNWRIVEPNEWLQVKKLYKVQAMQWSPATWQQMRRLYELPEARPLRRVFLNRDRKQVGRYLSNEQEVEAMLHRHGFETVFAEHLSMEQQTQLFQETHYLVALHGAGLIQQFFMNPDYGHVIEIMPADRLMPLFYYQGVKLRMRYFDVVVGGPLMGPGSNEYHVDVVSLEKSVQRMLTNTSPNPVYGRTVMANEASE